ncbi:MAG: hypothetical protein ACFCBV_04510 [Phycisphaerales bacterium]|nr:hypothetical protein [Phycisphaerales bacterium]
MKTREKLKTYFIGFGIGLILVGLMLYARGMFGPRQPQGQQLQQQPLEQQQQPAPNPSTQ